jgi:metallothionein
MAIANEKKEMAATKSEKCAHPVCSCVTTSGKYCSTECAAMEKTPDIDCACGHAGCKGRTSE